MTPCVVNGKRGGLPTSLAQYAAQTLGIAAIGGSESHSLATIGWGYPRFWAALLTSFQPIKRSTQAALRNYNNNS
jgi:hypothetical protein